MGSGIFSLGVWQAQTPSNRIAMHTLSILLKGKANSLQAANLGKKKVRFFAQNPLKFKGMVVSELVVLSKFNQILKVILRYNSLTRM
jgi:hypothetical protein